MERRTLYFNEAIHKYTDELNTDYTSVTTLVSMFDYKDNFKAIAKACERIGKNPNHPNHLKYRGKTAWQLEKEWAETTRIACEGGTAKHLVQETSIKDATKFNFNAKHSTASNGFIQLYTINHLLDNSDTGLLDLNTFAQSETASDFPIIHQILVSFAKLGYRIYSELGVYHPELGISGLIDAPLFRGNEFVIGDWKSNKDDIRYDAGYYVKDRDGKRTGEWISKPDKYMTYPLHNLSASNGNKYGLQLSLYAWILEQWGFKCKGLFIGHMTHDVYDISDNVHPSWYGKCKTKILNVPYLKDDIERWMEYYKVNMITEHKQVELFN